jgi:hypothetical protein
MVEGIRQQPNENDEAFLMRAERVMLMEQDAIRERARMMVAAAIRAFDKPETLPAGQDTLTKMVNASLPCYITRRSLLLARSLCREQLDASTGSDPVAQEAYQLLSRLALVALTPEPSDVGSGDRG